MLDGMTNIKASEVLKELKDYTEDLPHYSPDEVSEAIEMAINELEQQPCEDCISREQALLALTGMDLPTDRDKLIALFTERIQHLPPVTPQRQKGKWIEVFVETPNDPYSYGFKAHKCSNCEYRPLRISNYCPNCGAEMEVDDGTEIN